MGKGDLYHAKYVVTDPKTIFNVFLGLGFAVWIVYELIYGSLFDSFVLLAVLPLVIRNIYSSFNSYRKILLFNDRMQISGLLKNTYSEIYYDTIEHIGFVRVNVNRSFIYTRMIGAAAEQRQKLVMLLSGGGKVTLPEPSADEMNEILGFVKAKMEIGNFAPHGSNTISSSIGFNGNYSQIRFASSKTGLYVCAGIAFLFLIVILFSAIKGVYFASIFMSFMLIPAFTIGRSYYMDYREFLIYDDRLRVIDITGAILGEVYYSDIKDVGFLHSGTFVYNRGDSEGVRTEEMILLLYNGGRETITEDVSNLHELCSFIQEKIAKNN